MAMPRPAKPVPMISARVRIGGADVSDWLVGSAILMAPMLAGSGVVRHRVMNGLVGVQLDAEHLGGAADDAQRDRGQMFDELLAGHPPRAVDIRTQPPVGGCRSATVG